MLSNLPADLIFSIFHYCDISTVVFTGQTCRYLHDLAFCRNIWLGLLELVGVPDLQNLDTDDLLKLAKRMITGPEHGPEVFKEILSPWDSAAVLLPSGRHILFRTPTKLECWDVTCDKLVWRHISVLGSSPCFSDIRFAVEEMHGGNELVVMVCQQCDDAIGQFFRFVEIVKLLLSARVPQTAWVFVTLHSRSLAVVSTTSNTYFIADWKAQTSFCWLELPCRVELLPEHILVKAAAETVNEDELGVQEEVHIISNEALHTHLIPVVDLDGFGEFSTVSSDALPKLSTLSSRETRHSFSQISVHTSPDVENAPLRYGLWSYQLSIPVGQPPRWRERGVYPAWKGAAYGYSTYSGHAILYGNPQRWIVPPTQTQDLGEVDFPGCTTEYVHISPYSGAVTYPTEDTVIIQYFK
ncbi:hypothetical protein K438DRAFT_1822819 [Mycena galopus ATCC 62051]|nr:hypothetical protein K438DRAFT_1822819 [Mycena galopus ATCC 62051]